MSENLYLELLKAESSLPPGIRDALLFLSFDDWRRLEEHHAKDWIVVARSWREEPSDLFTFSVLAEAGSMTRAFVLEKPSWDVSVDFGKPSFHDAGDDGEVRFDDGQEAEIEGRRFFPFVIHRTFHGVSPRVFELVQGFTHYHEAFFCSELSAYQRVDETGSVHTVARTTSAGDNLAVEVDAHHLRDYLAAVGCYLVRYHDHRRGSPVGIDEYMDGEFQSHIITGEDYCYELWLRTDLRQEGRKTDSSLRGKDIVVPYEKPDARHMWWAPHEERRFSSFIVNRAEDGSMLEATCNEEELSDYFTDRGTPHFLTPVYFSLDVLARYYQEPSKFEVDDSRVRCLDFWILPVDVTAEDLVQVWLGDLGRIPHKEQQYWRQFNVPPRGEITRHRFRRDFLAEWADPDLQADPVFHLRRSLEAVQLASSDRHGDELFSPLDDADKHAYETLRVPLTQESKEFDEQIMSLAKLTVESLNVPLLSKESGVRIDNEGIKGSIDLLGAYLSGMGVEEQEIEAVLRPLRAIQTLRSRGVAHKKGKAFAAALRNLDLDRLSNRDRARRLIADTAGALAILASLISEVP
jgi:hypothetical protein